MTQACPQETFAPLEVQRQVTVLSGHSLPSTTDSASAEAGVKERRLKQKLRISFPPFEAEAPNNPEPTVLAHRLPKCAIGTDIYLLQVIRTANKQH